MLHGFFQKLRDSDFIQSTFTEKGAKSKDTSRRMEKEAQLGGARGELISEIEICHMPYSINHVILPFFRPCHQLYDVPFRILAATAKDQFRKPMPGSWYLVQEIFKDGETVLEPKDVVFVGNAAGRKRDHSSTDRKFAQNLGLQFYTPEVGRLLICHLNLTYLFRNIFLVKHRCRSN
jgi:hypothetical protein